MAFSSGAQRDLYYVEETGDFGVTPATPQLTPIRNTDDSLSLTRDSVVSDERRGDRGIHDMRLGSKQPGGDIGFEFSYEAFDDFLEAVFMGTWDANILKAGTTFRSFSIEKAFSDITEYWVFRGSVFNTFNLSLTPNAMITGSFGILSKDMDENAATIGDTFAAITTHRPFDAFTGSIEEGGAGIAIVTSLDFTLDNGFERNFVLMDDTCPQMTSGKSNITGNTSLYFENDAVFSSFVSELESSIEFSILDDNGKGYTFEFPRIKYTTGDAPVNADGAIVISMAWQALYDSIAGSNVVITRIV